MSIPQTSDSIANVLRLQGLKNVSGRRKVRPGEDLLEGLDAVSDDVSGTANEFNPPAQNIPELETGAELAPQSYDVRANRVLNENPIPNEMPLEQPEESKWTRLGRALANSPVAKSGMFGILGTPKNEELNFTRNAPPIATQQTEMAEGLPPVNPEEETGVLDALKRFGESTRKVGEIPQNAVNKVIENFTPRLAPEFSEQFPEIGAKIAQNQENPEIQEGFQAKIDQAQQNPLEVAVYGATDQVARNPELVKEFHDITGIDFTPQIEELTKAYEHVISDMENNLNQEEQGYSEQARRIKERILSNESSDADKYYIGIALLMPLLVGGIFGKEAGLGALGGAAKGVADVYANRANQSREDEELLAGINKNQGNLNTKRSELEVEKLKIPDQIRKSLPTDERAFLKGKREVVWLDPKTGQQKVGVEVKPGLVALPEFITDAKELEGMKKEAIDINEAKTATQLINSLTDDIVDISSKLKNKDLLDQGIRAYVLGKRPDFASKFSEKVEFQGRPVNAIVVLEHKLKLLTDAYRQAKGMRALTQTVQEHIDGLFRNPAASFQNYEDTIDQMLYTRDLAQKNLIQNASNHGFAPEFLEEEFGKQNKGVYGKLNKKEEEKMSSALLRE